ncbi:amino acid transporter, putative [Entamoeba invadens IP1]|uniref:Amino acid transporter, putative n=1 Tax=Entamoeba invadens IP1 TaxID=370355 RepID=A0A0A1TXL1_ENTIV|nr:amino acid transporter, putative [Entamoeba invadens IP1]ELP86090.1 amino acid transporter, putative [Entamoeba invadens IP1]|eukprot:XP_004185436.1 amino acid transporter, putative [Entamoeba invadens IP1]
MTSLLFDESNLAPLLPTSSLSEHPEKRTAPAKTINYFNLSMIVYFSIGGGPFGYEESILVTNPAWAFWTLFFVSTCWALPQSLTLAEMSVRYPGGYNEWVYRAYNYHVGYFHSLVRSFFGILCYVAYVTLFYDYINTLYHDLNVLKYADYSPFYFCLKTLTLLVLLSLLVLVNLLGTKRLSRFGSVLAFIVLTPFIVLFIILIVQHKWSLHQLTDFTIMTEHPSIARMISIIMFNLMGWDFVGSVTEQAKKPKRDVPLGMLLALGLVIITYVIPTLDLIFTFDFSKNPNDRDSPYNVKEPLYFVMAKKTFEPLGFVIIIATFCSMFGLSAMFLQTSSQALVHASDFKFVPQVFGTTTNGVPLFALLFQSVMSFFIALFVTFDMVVSLQMWVLSVSTIIIMLGYLIIRWKDFVYKRKIRSKFYLPVHPLVLTFFVFPTIGFSMFELVYKEGEWIIIFIGIAILVFCELVTLTVLYYRRRNVTVINSDVLVKEL